MKDTVYKVEIPSGDKQWAPTTQCVSHVFENGIDKTSYPTTVCNNGIVFVDVKDADESLGISGGIIFSPSIFTYLIGYFVVLFFKFLLIMINW